MRFLIDSAIHDMRNTGNNAMLEGTLNRLGKRWPDASLEVVTQSPHVLRYFFPGTCPVLLNGQTDWVRQLSPQANVFDHLPRSIRGLVLETNEEIRRRRMIKAVGKNYIRENLSQGLNTAKEQKSYDDQLDQIEDAISRDNISSKILNGIDLYVAAGGHYMCDVSILSAIPILDRLKMAQKMGIPVVMLGQGMGPIKSPSLLAKAQEVLPMMDLIAVREKLYAPQLLVDLGVERSKVMVTGDDALELAYNARRDKLGNGIGLGIRMMYHTEINEGQFDELKEVIHQAANLYRARLIAVPVSQNIMEADDQWIDQLMDGYSRKSISRRKFETSHEVIRRVGECRLVITGAYHTAVFALAQGIPAICIARSADYVYKVTGLADQFGEGCSVILLSERNWKEDLLETIKNTWQSAEYLKPLLLKAAARQIEEVNRAYNKVFELLEPSSSKSDQS